MLEGLKLLEPLVLEGQNKPGCRCFTIMPQEFLSATPPPTQPAKHFIRQQQISHTVAPATRSCTAAATSPRLRPHCSGSLLQLQSERLRKPDEGMIQHRCCTRAASDVATGEQRAVPHTRYCKQFAARPRYVVVRLHIRLCPWRHDAVLGAPVHRQGSIGTEVPWDIIQCHLHIRDSGVPSPHDARLSGDSHSNHTRTGKLTVQWLILDV